MIKRKKLKQVGKALTASTLAFSVFANPVVAWQAHAEGTTTPSSVVKLRVLGTTDLHTHMMDYDYYQDKPTVEFGLARTATLIKQAKAEVENSILVDNGDLIQGNPLGDYVAKVKPLKDGDVHPVFKAMNLLGYDAGTVGNHEFNYGLDFLDETLDDSPYSVVNSNVYVDDKDNNDSNDKPYFSPYKIIEKQVTDEAGNKQTIKVGIIGFVTPQIMQWDKMNLEGKVKTKDIVESAKKYVPQMKAEGADVVIALAHSGYGDTDVKPMEENAVYELSQVPDIDGIVFGHSHTVFPSSTYATSPGANVTKGTINGVAAVQPGNWGNNLGLMDLTLEQVDGKWNVVDSGSSVRAISKKVNGVTTSVAAQDQDIVNAVKSEHEGTVSYVNTGIGQTTDDINSYFSLVKDDPSIQLVTKAQTWYVKNQVKGTKYENLPILSAGAPFKAGGRNGASYYTNIPKGTIAIKNTSDLYIYPNTVTAIVVKGSDVKEWLEMAAGQFNQIDTTKQTEQSLINETFPTYNYDVIDGVTYEIDVTQPAKYDKDGKTVNETASRIKNLKYNGQAIDPNQSFLVVTNNYRASGTFPGVKNKSDVIAYPDENRQALVDYIRTQKTVTPTADQNWSFAKVTGDNLNITFTSSPDAQNLAQKTKNVKYIETLSTGFGKYQIDLTKQDNIKIQLLGVNDLHGQMDTVTKVGTRTAGGFDYLAAYLKQREEQNPLNTLMVHAGDAVGASVPASALVQDEPTIKFLNKLGFDIGTVGNHEFDEGVKEMLRLINGGEHPKTVEKYGKFEGANFPYVAANLRYKDTKENVLNPYVIKEVGGVKVGVIGVVFKGTPGIVIPSGVEGVEFTDETEAINKYAAELKDQGIETIVVLAHNPIKSETNGGNPTEQLVTMANNIDDEVDVIFGAHNHAYANTTVDGKLIVQAYSYGSALADVDLEIDPETKDVVSKKAEIVTTYRDAITPDAEISSFINKYKEDIKPITEQVLGTSAVELTRTQNEAGESLLGNVIADGMRATTKTDFAFMNPGGIRNDLNAGEITWGELFSIQPFNNDLVTMELTGQDIRDLLNQQWQPGKVRMLQISGLRFTWDSTKADGSKIINIYLPDGSKMDMNKTYTATVNSFMSGGGDGYAALLNGKNKVIDLVDIDALVNYVKAQKEAITAKIEGRILKDVIEPSVPTVNDVTNRDFVVSGTATPGNTVEVLFNKEIIATTTVKADGTYNVEVSNVVPDNVLSVRVKDDNGIISDAVTVKVKDVVGPEKVSVNTISTASKTINGKAEAGSTLYVVADGELLGNETVKADGTYEHVLTKKLKKNQKVTLYAIDKAGNKGEEITVVVQPGKQLGKAIVDRLTNETVLIKGKAEAQSTVEIYLNDELFDTIVTSKSGLFVYPLDAKLKAGDKVSFVVKNEYDLDSEKVTVIVDDVIAPERVTINPLTSASTKITGKTEASATVKVYVDSIFLGEVVANETGEYSLSLKTRLKKQQVVSVTVQDKSGNLSTSKPSVKVTPSKKLAKVNVSGDLTDKTTSIKGNAEANSNVIITINSKNYTAKTDSKGAFQFKLSAPLKATTTVSFVVTNDYDDTSDKVVKVVKDVTSPSKAQNVKASFSKKTVTGKAEAKATVKIYQGKELVGQGIVTDKGEFTVKVSKVNKNSTLSIYVIDTAGNKSDEQKVVIK